MSTLASVAFVPVEGWDTLPLWISFMNPIGYGKGNLEDILILSFCQPKPHIFEGNSSSIFVLTVGGYDRIVSGAIILRYSDAALLKVDIDYDHPTTIDDFFFFLLIFYHSEQTLQAYPPPG